MRMTPFQEWGGVNKVSRQKNLGRRAPFLVLSEPVAGAQDLIFPK